ncbi:hypothetical protein DsansV1_C21g0169381 [Dioscorea sansibarensis]
MMRELLDYVPRYRHVESLAQSSEFLIRDGLLHCRELQLHPHLENTLHFNTAKEEKKLISTKGVFA